MRRALSAFGTWLTKVESWATLGGMLMSTSVFAWLATQWNALSVHGWPAILIVAIACSSLVLIAMCLIYLTLSQYRRLKDAPLQQTLSTSNQSIGVITDQSTLSPRPLGARVPSSDRIHQRNERILLQSLVNSDFPIVENRIFENCEIIGPAFILPKKVRFEGRTVFRGTPDIDNYLVEIPRDRRIVSGAIEMRNCSCIDCAFVCVSFIAERQVLDEIRKPFIKPATT